MKQLIHIVFAGFLVLSISTGFTLHYHYCCGELQSVGLFFPPKPCCDEMSDCCHDESESFQLDSDFLITDFSSEIFELQIDFGSDLFNCVYQYNNSLSYSQGERIIDPTPPPNYRSYQVLFQSYLI